MDEASRHVVRFLEALTPIVYSEELFRRRDSLRDKLRQRGLLTNGPAFMHIMEIRTISHPVPGLYFDASISVTPKKDLNFGITLLSSESEWTIEAEVSLERYPEDEGHETLRHFPTRHANTLEECLAQLHDAISDLASCDDVVETLIERGLVRPPATP
jgi:hypothetical protein